MQFKQGIQAATNFVVSVIELFQLVENGTTFNSFYPSAHESERLLVYFLMLLQPSVVDIRRIVTEQPHEAI
ncbi:hypothetical protein T12_2991 [Trichinella patagoniensis]|uniref:Uncharacterized protein n=1 Tax=Trichinella patagoniensis TaxID=990121 RepID=A0A0V0ZY83_9BILA|nr:hypothetical protein T12_2991 [Trichinella patagoniensis]